MEIKEKLKIKLQELTDILISDEDYIVKLDEDSDEYLNLEESINDTREEINFVECQLGNIERNEDDDT